MPLDQETKDRQHAAFVAATDHAIEIAITKAEQAIQKVLHGLEHDTMMTVWNVAVDTRNFSQLRTEIFLTKAPRA